MNNKTLTVLMMDSSFEQTRTITAFRIIEEALERGHNVNVFAYEGAVNLVFARQKPHANSIHGRSLEEENHPLTKDIVSALMAKAEANGCKLDWINCGLCVDERGVEESIPGCRRGAPSDFWQWANQSDSTLVIGTK